MLFFEEFNYLNNMLENWYVPTRVSFEEPGFDHIVIKPDYTLFKEPWYTHPGFSRHYANFPL